MSSNTVYSANKEMGSTDESYSNTDPVERAEPDRPSAQMEERRNPTRSQNTRTVIRTWHQVEAQCLVDEEPGCAKLLGI